MTCRRLTPDLIDFARGAPLDRSREDAVVSHVRECATCAVLVERQRAMSAAFRRLGSEPAVPPVDARRLGALRAAFDQPRTPSRRAAIGVGLSLAASALIVAGVSVAWRGGQTTSTPVVPSAAATPGAAFIVLPEASALPRFEHGQVIRVQIPSSSGAIQADVLVGQDGLARAVRLVQ